jgi:hypothetical protein
MVEIAMGFTVLPVESGAVCNESPRPSDSAEPGRSDSGTIPGADESIETRFDEDIVELRINAAGP